MESPERGSLQKLSLLGDFFIKEVDKKIILYYCINQIVQ